MKQHMPNKPNCWGYKMFLLAGSEGGICYHFIFYTGKNNKQNPSLPIIKCGRPSLKSKLNENNSITTLRVTPTSAPPLSTRFDKYDH
ncbi:unnamed protein product [Rotaria sordida]|uniref:Uncharacterized protein n=1 Tax=Rotaria sordida TaxID=392033 RepID=A0A819RM56_9BILA|nr:unnamed protein product [Rotaria sordida]CAF4022387.1 unnamed protein product [Rotaria sordida]CAF4046249.1 unnamed protein product [Rotaria sordida]